MKIGDKVIVNSITGEASNEFWEGGFPTTGMVLEICGDDDLLVRFSDAQEWYVNLDDISSVGETRITDPDTGGSKGSKPEQPAQIPPEFLLALGRVYSFGQGKYPDKEPGLPNWSLGYSWSLSVNAAMRHLLAWLNGQDTDPESGESHLLHVAWHMSTIYTFQSKGLGTDDRPAY